MTAEDLLAMHLDELRVSYWRQFRYVPSRQFRADFGLLEHGLLIEVNGGVWNGKAHGSIAGILRDNERLNLATLNGWKVLRFTPDEVANGKAKEMIVSVLVGEEAK